MAVGILPLTQSPPGYTTSITGQPATTLLHLADMICPSRGVHFDSGSLLLTKVSHLSPQRLPTLLAHFIIDRGHSTFDRAEKCALCPH